ncbi:hypothetical protein KIN20_029336 [Parelaphostrongylus tenuis]|uniref:Uncharacterized protein n=1 Tax=Parelaphostrongylus tenuis TaxID=148309 RepID=A0AAD5R283_PARTN|nr:hypothetical protein KIN20_029336 [Parelaphostrongylus tenuis]
MGDVISVTRRPNNVIRDVINVSEARNQSVASDIDISQVLGTIAHRSKRPPATSGEWRAASGCSL